MDLNSKMNISHSQALSAIRNSRYTYLQSLEMNSIKDAMATIEQKYINYIAKNVEDKDQTKATIQLTNILRSLEIKQYNICWEQFKNKQKNYLKIAIKLVINSFENNSNNQKKYFLKKLSINMKNQKSSQKLTVVLSKKILAEGLIKIKNYSK